MPSLFLALLAFVLYANSLQVPFVFDDILHIVQNPDIGSWRAFAARSNRPLVALSLVLNFKLGGMSPLGYHLVNVALHALSALLLFALLRDLFGGAVWPALLVAAGFVAHPVQTESVTYVVSRSELLCSCFYLLALLLLTRMLRAQAVPCRWHWWAGAAAAAGLAAASKEIAVTLPLAGLLYDSVFISRGLIRALRRNWPFHASQIASWIVLSWLLFSREYQSAGLDLPGITPWNYLATQSAVVLHYLRLVFYPVGLCLDYDWRWASSLLDPIVLSQGALLLALLGTGFWLLSRRPAVGFGILWFFLLLAPTSSVLPIADPIFEHRLYLAIVGPLLCLVDGGRALLSLAGRKAAYAGVIVWIALVGIWAILTVSRNQVWNDPVLLWQDTVAKAPNKGRPHLQLGQAYVEKGMIEEAEREFKLAVERRYDDRGRAKALTNLAGLLIGKERCSEARPLLIRAIKVYDRLAMSYYGLAICDVGEAGDHAARGHVEQADWLIERAISQLERAIKLSPGKARIRYLLGKLLISLGRSSEGREHLKWLAHQMPYTDEGRKAKAMLTGGSGR